jgi:uncharacterized protein (DUF1800 family)
LCKRYFAGNCYFTKGTSSHLENTQQNRLLEKTNPILCNRRLVLAFSNIFVFNLSKNIVILQNEPNYCQALTGHGLKRYFLYRKTFQNMLFAKRTQFLENGDLLISAK